MDKFIFIITFYFISHKYVCKMSLNKLMPKQLLKMKKVLLFILTLTVLFFTTGNLSAQTQMKIGVFDIDLMVQNMPGYKNVDSLVQIYNRDSLGAEYEIYQNEFHRL